MAKEEEKKKQKQKRRRKLKPKSGPLKWWSTDAHTSTHFLATHFPFAFLHCGHNTERTERSRLERVEFPLTAAAHHMASQPATLATAAAHLSDLIDHMARRRL